MSLKAIVKSVLSGDTLVLRGRPGPQGQPPKERVLHLADVSAPRLGNAQRDDEPFAFESRDFLRTLVVGKEISFTSIHSLPSTDNTSRDFGHAQLGDLDIVTELLKSGWAKVKENKRDDSDTDVARKALEAEARSSGKGLWAVSDRKPRTVYYTMPPDPQSFLNEHKGQNIDALVESVKDGSTLRIRLMLPGDVHQIINLALAGVRSPRASGRETEIAEPWGDEAKFFTESRIGQRAVRVQLLALPTPSGIPFSSSASAPPAPASIIIGTVLHPAGNIAEHLVAGGLARVVDWHAGMLGASGGMERLRVAEKAAKEKRLGLYENIPILSNGSHSGDGTLSNNERIQFDAQVIRIWSGDQISVLQKGSSKERRLQLSSLRAPRAETVSYAAEAKEFLRKKLIGKIVHVKIDFVRPAEGEFEERECATIRYGGGNINVAEQLIDKGLATALRHKRDDENRSPDYDKLTAAEQSAVAEARGIHSGKTLPVPRIGNASETAAKAVQFLNSFKRIGKMAAQVLNVTSGTRFKLFIPKENQTLTFVLSGIRGPRPARAAFGDRGPRGPNESNTIVEKAEPYGQEALDFSIRRYMQRDVEVEFDSTDKSGGFIGTLYVNRENVALELVRGGLATIHAYSADTLPWAKLLYEAEAEAKTAKRNIWADYNEDETIPATVENGNGVPLKLEYLDVIISDVRSKPDFSFSVQMLNNDGIAALERLMYDFSLHHRTAPPVPGFTPRSGELVSARFSGDGGWYRAKVRRSSPAKKEAELSFIDYGNQEIVSFPNIRPLDQKFRALAGQAQDAHLSFVTLIGAESEYHDESIERFQSLCAGRKLIANVDHREGGLLHLRLIDPADPASASDPTACINADLVREGLAIVDRKIKYAPAYPDMLIKLQAASESAKKDRAGIYEFGDISPDDN